MSLRIVSERPEQHDAIERMLDAAFGPGRFAKTSERVRERGARFEAQLSRVALREEAVIGCCRIWSIGVGSAPAFFLGPLGVDPGARRDGVGAALTLEAVAACRSAGGSCVILVGARAFFGPLGFQTAPEGALAFPGPVDASRVLWTALKPGGLDGVAGVIGPPPG